MVVGARSLWDGSLVAALLCLACQTPDVAGGPAEQTPELPSECQGNVSPGPSPIRRLNRFEYNNTVLELLGDDSQPASSFPPEESGNGFGNDATALSASQLLVERLAVTAQELAANATTGPRWSQLVGCEPSDDDAELACVAEFIARFGLRAFRGPVSEGEQQRLLELFQTSRQTRDFRAAIADVMAVMLQSPRLLYRVELDGPQLAETATAQLSSYEVASRLSYLFWGSMPDAELFELAARGELQTPTSIRAQAERLLADERARRTVKHFHATLFGLSGLDFLRRSLDVFPHFTDDLGPLLRRETETFLEHAFWEDDGKFATLMAAPYTFINARLADFYGVSGPTGDSFEQVVLDPTRRAGFLTQAGPMAALTPGAATNPVSRGIYIRGRLFCDPPPDPSPTLMVQEPAADSAPTARERFANHRTEPVCSACHRVIDPLGLPFENYDGLGQWRDSENGVTIDASGDLVDTDVAGPVSNAVELVQRIARSEQAQRCYANHWMSYAYGRGFAAEDACTRARVEAEFLVTGGDIRQLLLALTQTDAFRYRSVEAP